MDALMGCLSDNKKIEYGLLRKKVWLRRFLEDGMSNISYVY
jgi:hypothetical protein